MTEETTKKENSDEENQDSESRELPDPELAPPNGASLSPPIEKTASSTPAVEPLAKVAGDVPPESQESQNANLKSQNHKSNVKSDEVELETKRSEPEPEPVAKEPLVEDTTAPEPLPKTPEPVVEETPEPAPEPQVEEAEDEEVKKEPIIIAPEPVQAVVKPILSFLDKLKVLRGQANQARTANKQKNLEKILAYAREHNRITNDEVEKITKVGHRQAVRYLNNLVKTKQLVRFGAKSNIFYKPVSK